MSNKKSAKKRDPHRSSVHWFNMDYLLQNGFLLPASAHSALCQLVSLERFTCVDAAILEGIKIVLEENTPLLTRSGSKWIAEWVKDEFKDPSYAKPDVAGEENVRLLEKMYESMRKAEGR